jgi:hypothetical protein
MPKMVCMASLWLLTSLAGSKNGKQVLERGTRDAMTVVIENGAFGVAKLAVLQYTLARP